MRLTTIGQRIAAELRSADLVAAGLQDAYYPAPSKISAAGPVALVFAGLGSAAAMQEQIWHHEVRVQLMVPSRGFYAAEVNSIEPLIEPIWDHFAPDTTASRLIQSGEAGSVTHCIPLRYEASQLIAYGGETNIYAAITVYFDVKVHRFAGDA